MHKIKWTEVEGRQKLDALLDEIANVYTVSESAQTIMEMTRAGEVNLTAVVDAVMKDPSLAAELIRLANSPLFGQAKQVSDIKRAVVVLGMQELHNIAAAMSMMAAFATPNPLSTELRNLSVLSAATARLTARHLGTVDESEAFLSGLLAEIGAMACNAVDTVHYTALWQSVRGDREARARLETERYSEDSAEIGYLVLKRNKLPEGVASAVRAAAVRAAPGERGMLGRITAFSRRVTPLILLAAETSNENILNEDIPAAAEAEGLPSVPAAHWAEICVQAAVTAELGLRGETMLSNDVDNEELVSAASEDPAAFEMSEIVYAETTARRTHAQSIMMNNPGSSVRMDGEPMTLKKRILPIRAALAVVAAVGAVGAIYWFFFAA